MGGVAHEIGSIRDEEILYSRWPRQEIAFSIEVLMHALPTIWHRYPRGKFKALAAKLL
jgi:hypothetical protein